MTRPRVAVIGAGPAGSTAARLLAERGASVTLLEARSLPRPKLCGGGLTPKAQRLVPPEALSTVDRRVSRVELRTPHLRPFRIEAPEATIAMVERTRFDLALVEVAAAAGVEVRDAEPVRDIVESEASVELRTSSDRLVVDAAVVADGEPSGLSRRLGLGGPPRRLALAIEVDLPFAAAVAPDTAVLAFGLRGGYGWYFPKGDHANVGVGSYRASEHARLRADLARFTHDLGLDAGAGQVRGHWIPQGLRSGPLSSGRVVLAGDAAATADALFGEGISYALLSGVAAAQSVGAWADGTISSLRDHDGRLRSVLAPALDRLHLVALAAEASVSAAILGVRLSHFVRDRAIDAISGRAAPFAIDRSCEFACACGLQGALPATPMTRVRSAVCDGCAQSVTGHAA